MAGPETAADSRSRVVPTGDACAGTAAGKAIRETLDRVGDKWSLLVVISLDPGPRRFTELRRSIPGISQRMLTLTVRQLERDGLVSRTVYAQVPPRVEYAVTDLGRTLIEPVRALADWAVGHQPDVEAARTAYDDRSL